MAIDDEIDMEFPAADEIEVYKLTEATAETTIFRPGDHVWMWCETIGGMRYQHHGILVKVVGNKNPNIVYIADFTAPDADESNLFALPTSMTSSASTSNGATTRSPGRLPSWHGVRITTYNASEWHKEIYEDDYLRIENNALVLQRVKFLLQNPHLLPKYELLESNCEAVAVWCRTGRFHTQQVSAMMDGVKQNSAIVTGAAAVAAGIVGALAIPVVVGAGISWSVMSMKQNDNENKWKERTRILNAEFQKWLDRQGSGHCIIL